MRIAILSTSYPQHPEDPSGHFVRAHAQQLAQQGHDVYVICPVSRRHRIPRDAGVIVCPIYGGGAFGWPGMLPRLRDNPMRLLWLPWFITRAQRLLRHLSPAVVVAHWLVPCGYPVALAALNHASLELVAHGADVRLLVAMPSVVRNRIMRLLLNRADRIRFAARSIQDSLLDALSTQNASALRRVACVDAPPIDVPDVDARIAEIRRCLDGIPLATVVGRLVPSKRVRLAVDAVASLNGRMRLRVIGDGPEREALMAACSSPYVSFAGQLDRTETLAWIGASDVLLHPSMHEAAPSVVREARLLNTPVISCVCGDVGQWSKHDAGIQVVAADAAEIAGALERLLVGN